VARARAFDLRAGQQLAFGLAAILRRERVGQWLDGDFVPAESDVVLVAGDAEIQGDAGLNGGAVERQLARVDRDAASIELHAGLPVGDRNFPKIKTAD